MSLEAIETHYAGCRFRSRLEARWAVFFDRLRMDWLYEPQGYTVGPEATRYLPDFYLPRLGVWVEVKGALDDAALRTLIYAACEAGLPLEPGKDRPPPQAFFPWRSRILLLGSIPEPGPAWLHTCLEARAGDLVLAQPVTFVTSRKGMAYFMPMEYPATLNQFVAGASPTEAERKFFTDGIAFPFMWQPAAIERAYTAARSARFEHGETPKREAA